MSFDPKCQELAEHFLPDGASERSKKDLSQYIQDQIEEWLEGVAEQLEQETKKGKI